MVVNKLRHKEQLASWSRHIWKNFLHLFVDSNVWKLIQGVYTDDVVMISNGYDMVSRCFICEEEQNSMHHLLWKCKFSIEIWGWICSIFKFKLPEYFEDVWKSATKTTPLAKQIWITVSCNILKELWFQKNKKFFEDIKPNMQIFK